MFIDTSSIPKNPVKSNSLKTMGLSSRKATEDRLDYYYRAVKTIILSRQNPNSGLIPASVAVTTHGDYRDAWVRDNVYSILAVWGVALAYGKLDDGDGRAFELEHSVVKLMRGLLFAMMRQAHKVEKFKNTQSIKDSLHAKYNTNTGDTVVGDDEWGHLQVDATSIFLLMIAQMTAGGMNLIYTLDEVDFIQNLVFYIERAYRTPDYGIWERGNKVNHGEPELNCSSLGMVVAALQAIDGVNLFGSKGGPSSIIHVLPDEVTRNYSTLHSFLPRESNSKEIDAALLSVVGFPAFAIGDADLAERTRNEIITKLGGVYGCKRFLRDGHQAVLEDHSRLHYDPSELKIFEHIECEWPLFFTYLILDGLFSGDQQMVEKYRDLLEPILVDSEDVVDPSLPIHQTNSDSISKLVRTPSSTPGNKANSFPLVPEVYYVPRESIEAEKANPNSQKRLPNENVPLVWANSLYFLGNLLYEGLLEPSQLDPLARRLNNRRDPNPTTVVQVAIITESLKLKKHLSGFGLETQTLEEISPINVCDPGALKEIYSTLGYNNKLGLSGRPKRPIGSLGTSRIYRINGQLYVFTPHFMDFEHFYLSRDNQYFISVFEHELQFVQKNWYYPGRPTMTVLLTEEMMSARGARTGELASYSAVKGLLDFLFKVKSGSCNGIRTHTGNIREMVNTSSVTSLDFLINKNDIDLTATLNELNRSSQHSVSKLKNSAFRGRIRRSSSSLIPTNTLNTPIKRTESQEYFNISGTTFKLKKHEQLIEDGVEEDDSGASSPREPLSLNLYDPSQVSTAIEHLAASNNLFDQMDLAHYIHSCHGSDFYVHALSSTIGKIIEEIYSRSITLKLWSVVRQSAGVLRKMADSLTINITDLIIRQKRISVGSGAQETQIDTAVTPDNLQRIIYDSCSADVREGPLVQELITYLGSFIRGDASMFDGILQLRLRNIVISLREEISRLNACNEDDAVEILMNMSPFEVKSLLYTILSGPGLSNENTDAIIEDSLTHLNTGHWRNVSIHTSTQPENLSITVKSGGFCSGNFVKIEINGKSIPIDNRGFNLVALNLVEGTIFETGSFDTHWNDHDSNELVKFINRLPHGLTVVGAVKDEASEKLFPDAIAALKTLGLVEVQKLAYRDAYCFVGVKGSTPGSAAESLSSESEKPAELIDFRLPKPQFQALVKQFTPSRLVSILEGECSGRWLRRRKNDGSFNRVPSNFYPMVWKILTKSQGLRLGSKHYIPRDPTVSEKTPDEFNFAMLVENFLCKFYDPAERQIAIELLTVLSYIQEHHPEFNYTDRVIDMGKLIVKALNLFWKDWVLTHQDTIVTSVKDMSEQPTSTATKEDGSAFLNIHSLADLPCPPTILTSDFSYEANEPYARRLFYDLPQRSDKGTAYFLIASLLEGQDYSKAVQSIISATGWTKS